MKKVSRSAKLFDELPPRVIIFDILAYYKMRIFPAERSEGSSSFTHDDYSLFGIYRRDRRRNIWYFFTSVEFVRFRLNEYVKTFVEFKKLGYLEFSMSIHTSSLSSLSHTCKGIELLSKEIIKKSPGMYRLTHLVVEHNHTTFNDEAFAEHTRIFSEPGCYPKLKSFITRSTGLIHSQKTRSILNSIPDTHHFNELKELKIIRCLGNEFLKKRKETIENLTRLNLTDVRFKNKIEFEFLHLEKLALESTQNIVIKATETLLYLRIERVSLECVKETFKNAIYLNELDIQLFAHGYRHLNIPEIPSWFLDEKFNPLKHLDDVVFDTVFFNERLQQEFSRLQHQFKRIEFRKCTQIDQLLKLPFPKLKRLHFRENFSDSEPLKDLPFSTIKSLSIFSEKVDEDIIFKNQKFKKLENLLIWFIDFNFVGWKKIESLKTLNLFEVGDITQLFQGNYFPFLEELAIEGSGTTLNGITIDEETTRSFKFENLKRILIKHCDNLSDVIFSNFEYPCLNLLYIDQTEFFAENTSSKFTGKNWTISNCEIAYTRLGVTFELYYKQILEKKNVKFRKVKDKSHFDVILNDHEFYF